MSSRHKLREMGMSALYQSFLLNKDIKQCVYDISENNEIDPFLYTITIDAITYKDTYIEAINRALRDDWEFHRLGYVEQAILVMAACELDLGVSPKQIVVDEAVILAKKYCDEETYKLINGVLDHL
ncbi:MAG: transcription antitermination factor NusB [Erysipelotrichaceae bacterium]|nr:transcription antitermination factor NusB [Erysipelotrichaceae bacterium]MCI9311992.1 transcription antitermination factor NusB [Erysipelotrichaceae bacterium]